MINYARLASAEAFYWVKGYDIKEVPWTVSKKAVKATIPKGSHGFYLASNLHNVSYGDLIGSAEQGFIQLMIDGSLEKGKYQATSPCFRNENTDKWHQQYFMKVELFNNIDPSYSNLQIMVETALEFFKQYVPTAFVDCLGDHMYDIMAPIECENIELGSYGIRDVEGIGSHIYGTGLAEPRLSLVMAE